MTLVLAGCPASSDGTGTDGTSGTSADATGTGTTSNSTTGEAESSTTDPTTGGSTTSGDSSSTGIDCSVVEPVDNPEMYNCSLVDQDCPACHKCTHAWDGDNETYPVGSGTICVPVHEDPVGVFEPCSYDGLGLDNCGADAFCWSPDEATTDGYCVAFCGADYSCAEGSSCAAGAKGDLGCLPTCDPFAPDCPDEGEDCLFLYDETQCVWLDPDFELPGDGEECSSWCAEGFACVSAEAYGPGCEFQGCCTPLCDADNPCASAEQECLGECGEPPEGISVCTVPTEPNPAQCPPEDAEPNYPWCSEQVDECDQSFGGGNDCVTLCFCDVPCNAPGDCPVPATGTPTVECTDAAGGGDDICMLSCANGETCPNGMYCDDELYPGYCMWFVEETPGCTQE